MTGPHSSLHTVFMIAKPRVALDVHSSNVTNFKNQNYVQALEKLKLTFNSTWAECDYSVNYEDESRKPSSEDDFTPNC